MYSPILSTILPRLSQQLDWIKREPEEFRSKYPPPDKFPPKLTPENETPVRDNDHFIHLIILRKKGIH